MVGDLLTTVYQASANSSAVARAAAARVASALGSSHLELDIEPLVGSYVAMIEKATGRTLSWEQDDLALQNIQARVRAPGVWMLANLRGALLLATSNRSEAALGYATMDGDTCGGISPIGGIDKAFLRHWLEWLETTGPEGLGPVPALAVVTKQHSTPELRPQDSNQSSEGDLMPFPVLDAIERLAIRDKLVPRDVLSDLAGRFRSIRALFWANGSSDSLFCSLGISGSASAMRRRSTSTTRTWTQRRGAVSDPVREDSDASSPRSIDAQGPDHR